MYAVLGAEIDKEEEGNPALDVSVPFLDFVHLFRDGKGQKTDMDLWMAETGIKWPTVFFDNMIKVVTLRFDDDFSAIAFKMRWA